MSNLEWKKIPLDRLCFMDYMINESYIHGGIYG